MTAATLSLKSSKVKFRLAGGAQPLILLPVHVNDRGPFDFILDTGAGTSLLSSELAKQLEVKVIGSKEGQSAGGKVSVSLAKVNSLVVGETKLGDVDVGIVDLGHIAKTIGAKIDGDLGYNFLKHFRVTINYRDFEIRLEDPKRVEGFTRDAKTETPIRLANPAKPLILVDVHANGGGPFQFAIDTGTSTSAITPELAKQLGIQTSPVGAGTTGGAPVDFSAGSLQSFQLGSAKIDNMAVIIADFFTMLNAAIGAKLDGIVGYNFLRNYKVVIDYPRETLTLF
ncbi:MAG TPA: retroviral-like aspartic protease family protein [Chthoniobacterales bacterium]|jgi:predicted aspartyl protease|nr:retroviral-like aspartic protease family protein [Chthoniobacterales bacterium]